MILIIDYGMGNLRSVQKGLEKAGYEAVISSNPREMDSAKGVVLPGVGAMGDCYAGLDEAGFVEPVKEWAASGKPLLGICVGMQLLFDRGEEGGGCRGLGILPGEVVRFPDPAKTGLKVPHMGWNRLDPVADRSCALLETLPRQAYVYFVHSYYPVPAIDEHVYATTEYGTRFAAVVGRGSVFATQFHPEKSQAAGIGILKAYAGFVDRGADASRGRARVAEQG